MVPAPRLYALVATASPVALVFARGPTAWWSLHRWDLATGDLIAGAWFHGTLYPRRCDLSPDGALLCYFALKATANELFGRAGQHAYTAIGRAPWLFALAAWSECGTWTRGYHFVDDRQQRRPSPSLGDAEPLYRRHGLAPTPAVQYAAERRRGWVEHEECPPRRPNDMWDEGRSVVLARSHGEARLVLRDRGWDPAGRIEGRGPSYELEIGGSRCILDDVTWADWDPSGRLLVATRDGRLQIREPARAMRVVCEHVLADRRPAPEPAPAWARRW